MVNHHYDIIIIGGGIVGLTLACQLQNFKGRIAIIESSELSSNGLSEDYDLRVFAINRASQNSFKSLGLWQKILSQRASPYRKMFVWEPCGGSEIEFVCKDVGEPDLGHIIEHQVIHSALLEKVDTLDHINLLYPIDLKRLILTEDGVKLETKQKQKLSANLVIGADGCHSWLRQQTGIEQTEWNYGHEAIVATVETVLPHQDTAWECFNPEGPLALLPLADPHHCSIVWSVETDKARKLMALDDAHFKTELEKAFHARLGQVVDCSKRRSFPLHMRHAKQYVRHRIALVGDAIHTFHPLAGQGLNTGLLDASVLADIILNCDNDNKPYFSLSCLRQYERKRKGQIIKMIALMEGFKFLFSKQPAPIRYLRSLGLSSVNQMLPLKRFFIKQAMDYGST